jgi:hypothetical protein
MPAKNFSCNSVVHFANVLGIQPKADTFRRQARRAMERTTKEAFEGSVDSIQLGPDQVGLHTNG